MVGEIRDRETADIAIRAALTGHFVFSTLHTNDAPSAITRLTDMGVENYLITLVAGGRAGAAAGARHLPALQGAGGHAYRRPRARRSDASAARAASSCFGTGFTGRIGIFELMELNDELRKLIMANADAAQLTAAARRARHAQPARGRLAQGRSRA